MQIITKNINDVVPYEHNPRKNEDSVDKVAESIKQFGFKVPLVIDKNNVIVTGHTRYKAAKKLGIKEVPCIIADDLTEEQVKSYRLADNKVGEFSSWDIDLLEIELDEITEIDMSEFGFDFDEDVEEQEIIDDEYECDLPEEPKSKRGDIYQLGMHRLMCGDSTNVFDFEKLMDGQNADISFTSPPYNAGTTPSEIGTNRTTKYNGNNDSKTDEDYLNFLNEYLHNVMIYSEYAFMNVQSIANNKTALIDLLHDNKDIYADTIIWDKVTSQPAMGMNVLNSEFEYVHVFSKKANRAIGTIDFRGTLANIIHIPKQSKNEYSNIHNATFPIEFALWFVKNFANESVIEPFCGTGTTLIVCEQLNKKCFAMEYEPKYVDVIIDRWENLTGQKAVLLNGNK